MYIGSHVSIRNGYFHAAKTAYSIGATAFQYFPKNPRSLKVKGYNEQDATNCFSFCQKHKIISIAHTPYPTKLIPEDQLQEKQIIASMENDLSIAESCGSIGIVVHFGDKQTSDPLSGYKKMIQILNSVLKDWKGKAIILLENNAGVGSIMGTTLEEMVQIRNLVNDPEKIGFCFDTCHAYASGLWSGDNWGLIEDKGEKLGYFKHLKAVHLNNSKYPTGQRKDRHANLKNGFINEQQLTSFLYSPVIQNIPLILETPNEEKYTHEAEIKLVKNWIIN